MNTVFRDDFAAFINYCELFNSSVKLYANAAKSPLLYEGKGIYDKKGNLVPNEDGMISFQGHKSFIGLTKSELTFMTNYSSLAGYYIDITDNEGEQNFIIVNSIYNSNVGSIYCELREA